MLFFITLRFFLALRPDSDRFHQGHFHFDTARRRSGSICR
ncbi:extensin family protein [Ruegeria meonggei]|nr:extensin family protein [Ruegeria meonggei]